MVSFYNIFMFPLEKMGLRKARKEVMKRAKKKVLEIGSGTGANLPFYNFDVIDELILSDQGISKKLSKIAYNNKDKFTTIEFDVEKLPFEDNSIDTIVHSLVFCTVNDVDMGLSEIKRVLKSDGSLIFIEHVLPRKNPLKSIFSFLTPAWKKIGNGCHLNRDYIDSLKKK